MMTKEKTVIYIGEEAIELKGVELKAFNEQRLKDQAEAQISKDAANEQKGLKISAYTKLGLTEEEINAIL